MQAAQATHAPSTEETEDMWKVTIHELRVLALLSGESEPVRMLKLQRNYEERHKTTLHKQNFRRGLESMAKLGHVHIKTLPHESRIHSGGRPARKVVSITDAGRTHLTRCLTECTTLVSA